jgi:hypothetical protein
MPRNGFDVLLPAGRLRQRFPEIGYVSREGHFFDKRIGPQSGLQFVFGNQAPAVFYQHKQGVEDLWSQGHGPRVAQEQSLPYIEAKFAELVLQFLSSRGRHQTPQAKFKKNSMSRKDFRTDSG